MCPLNARIINKAVVLQLVRLAWARTLPCRRIVAKKDATSAFNADNEDRDDGTSPEVGQISRCVASSLPAHANR